MNIPAKLRRLPAIEAMLIENKKLKRDVEEMQKTIDTISANNKTLAESAFALKSHNKELEEFVAAHRQSALTATANAESYKREARRYASLAERYKAAIDRTKLVSPSRDSWVKKPELKRRFKK